MGPDNASKARGYEWSKSCYNSLYQSCLLSFFDNTQRGIKEIYLQDNNPDASAQSDYIVEGDLAEVTFHYSCPDEMTPLHSHCTGTRKE